MTFVACQSTLSLQNTKLNQHLFWVAVGILQLGESTLYAAGLGLMEACIKVLTNIDAFEEQVRIIILEMPNY